MRRLQTSHVGGKAWESDLVNGVSKSMVSQLRDAGQRPNQALYHIADLSKAMSLYCKIVVVYFALFGLSFVCCQGVKGSPKHTGPLLKSWTCELR